MDKKREYDQATLQMIQKIELSILAEFSEICKKNGWTYFAMAGTALGAIRHKGFIPWDDDIDVGMPREDMNQFIQYIKDNLSDKYLIINADEYDNYPLMTTQLALKGTSFVPEFFKDLDIPFGIYLDIFPFDNTCDDNKKMKKQGIKTWFYSKLLILRNIPTPYVEAFGIKKKIIHLITKAVHIMMDLLRVSGKKIYRKTLKVSTMYNQQETKRLAHFSSTRYDLFIMKKTDIFPLQELEFENQKILCPHKVKKQLRHRYGDYLKLPPIEKRKNHFPYRLDFGKYGSD